jgi:RNA recognition motif-containing protein
MSTDQREIESEKNNDTLHPEDEDHDKVNDLEDVEGKIFVGKLSWETTEQALREYFEKFGELIDLALFYDRNTGNPRFIHSIFSFLIDLCMFLGVSDLFV